MTTYLLALDQGTSSSRSIVFDREGHIVAIAQKELTQIYPQPGWVEHDPMEIWRSQLATAREVLVKAKLQPTDIHAIGITNQRETTVLWNRKTGQPVHHAIVWQDRRAEPLCARLRDDGMTDTIREKTGLVIDAYFSGTKLRWLLDNVPGAREQAERGELAFGTIDSWLMWQLTGGKVHVTDVSNASRTMLFNVHDNSWDADLLKALDIPAALMPKVQPSSSHFADTDAALLGHTLPIGGVAGDQQSALFGQACFEAGMAKNTYGTGCFLLMHTGGAFQPSHNGLLVTSAAQTDTTPQYAMEGSVFVGGAVVQWLRDGLKAIKGSAEVQSLAESVRDKAKLAEWTKLGKAALDEATANGATNEPLTVTFPAPLPTPFATRLRGAGLRWNKVLQHWEGLADHDIVAALAAEQGGSVRRVQSAAESDRERDRDRKSDRS